MTKKNAQLFEEFIQGISANGLGTSAEAEKPFPMTDSLPLWYTPFISKLDQSFIKIDIAQYKNNREKLQEILPTVSNLRFVLYKMMRSYAGLTEEQRSNARTSYQNVFNFLLESIKTIVPQDSYCHHANLLFSQKEISEMLDSPTLTTVESEVQSRQIAKLNLGLMSLVHGLYNDIVTDYGVDVYGPYEVEVDNEKYVLLIKQFPELNPADLNWNKKHLSTVGEVWLYLFYQGMEWEIKGVGCHTNILQGNPITDLRKYAVIADSKLLSEYEIESLTKESLKKAQDLYLDIIDSGFEEQKKQAIYQEFYQFNKVFTLAGESWQPTADMLNQVKDREITPTPGILKNIKEYKTFLKIDQFISEVLE